MGARNGLISYDGLPISSGGAHSLGRLRPRAAWQAFQRFLSTCTTATKPQRVLITIRELSEADPAMAKRLRDSAKAMLGIPARPSQHQDLGEKGASLTWQVAPALADAAVEWLAASGPLQDDWIGGPANVELDYQFRLKSAGGKELPFQSSEDYLGQEYNGYGVLLGESGCRLTLAARPALSLVLFLPFEEPDANLWKYVSFLQKHMLMKFSKPHWKHWKLAKNGRVFVSRRIALPIIPTH
jgi:hypothetical protein